MSFFSELRRRNVFRVATAYVVVAWLIIQVVSAISAPLRLPDWFETVVVVLLSIGFPLALLFAWAFELTPDGIRLTQSRQPSAPFRDNRLDYALLAALVAIAGVTLWSHWPSRSTDRPTPPATVTEQPSIAVLPFVDMSPEADQAYFADGISEELLNVLTRLDGLRVAGRTSSFAFKQQDDDLRTIGQALDVSTILEGSVRKDGERIRVTAQLINVGDGYHIWSSAYDRELTSVFEIQEDIAKSVAGALGVRLGVGNVNEFIGAGTRNVEAYDAYLKGYSIWDTQGESIRWLEEATRLDPEYAAAWAELGIRIAHLQWGSNPEDAPAIMQRAYEPVQRAIELNPESSRSLSRLGTVLYARFDWIGGEQAHQKALNLLSDRMALEHYGNLLMRAGRLNAANEQHEIAVTMERNGGDATSFGWQVSLGRGEFEEAEKKLQNYFRDPPTQLLLAIALNEGNVDEIKRLLAAFPANWIATRVLYGPVLQRFDAPDSVLDTLRAVYADDASRWPSKYDDIAMLAAYFGDADFALQVKGVEARLTAIRLQTLWYPLMAPVRRLDGFKDLVTDINLVPYWRTYGWADSCRPLDGEDFSCE